MLAIGFAILLGLVASEDDATDTWNKFSMGLGSDRLTRAFSSPSNLMLAIDMEPAGSLLFDCSSSYQFGRDIGKRLYYIFFNIYHLCITTT